MWGAEVTLDDVMARLTPEQFFCNKCGYHSTTGPEHKGCSYLAAGSRVTWDAAGLRRAIEEYGRGVAAEALRGLDADKLRLDALDAMNARKNAQNGSTYGWKLTENGNRIALEDHGWPALSVRAAIDAATKKTGVAGG